jgi:hypothetical protein
VRSPSPDSDREAGSGSCSDGASEHDGDDSSSLFPSSDEHGLEEEEAPEDAEALLDSRKRKALSPEVLHRRLHAMLLVQHKAVQQSVIIPMFWAPNEEYMNWYEKPYVSDSEDETDEVSTGIGTTYILAAMTAELKKRRYVRRWHAACQRGPAPC